MRPEQGRRRAWLEAIQPVVLGAAGVLCFAPVELFWLAPLVLAGLFRLLARATTPRQAFVTGWLFGSGFLLAGVSWIYVSLSVFGNMPWWLAGPATALLCLALALLPGASAWLFKRWQPAAAWQQALYFAVLLALTDWVRGWIFTGFPWLAWGYSQTPPSPLAGFAPLVGVYGLSLLVALGGALLPTWRLGLPFLAALTLGGYGLRHIEWTAPSGPPISVALIQGNVPQEMKWQPEHFIRTLLLYRDLVAAHPAQLTVLPETAIPAFFDQLPGDFVAEVKRLAQRQGGDLILGTPTGGGDRYWNSAISLGTSPLQTYSKRHLVPFGEFIPGGFAWFMAMADIPMSEFSRGPEHQPPLAVAGQQVAADICYEDAFGEEIIAALPQATLLVNLSNTAWFGHSLAQPQHLQISRLRALETGRPMLRATNTGMTAVITPDGLVQAVLPPFATGVLREQVQGYQGVTPYVRWGNALFLGLAALGLVLAQGLRRRAG